MMITLPFYKPVEEGTKEELIKYIQELRLENTKISNMYNNLKRKYIDQEIRINQIFVMTEQIKEKIIEGYPDYHKGK
jgi:hypothetical protein